MRNGTIKHLDLFSGIGGFALATEMAFECVEHTFCDNETFSQKILKKHWPNSIIHGDIRRLTTDPDRARELQQEGELEAFRRWVGDGVDILTGGFPCQPFSAAGRRLGTEDDRHLWPEMLRVIRETNPTYVLGENVGGFLTWEGGLVFEQVCVDLEEAGYEVCPFVIPAVAVNAPHRRDRVWIAAHRHSGLVWDEPRRRSREVREGASLNRRDHQDVTDAKRKRGHERSRQNKTVGIEQTYSEHGGASWDEDWPSAATRLCSLDDGLPNGLARPKGWRNAALKGAGNAIVPQVAAEILKAMVYS